MRRLLPFAICLALAGVLLPLAPAQAQTGCASQPVRSVSKVNEQGTAATFGQTNMSDAQFARVFTQVLQSAGTADDWSPTWTNSDGRIYDYKVSANVYYVTSSPCSGNDTYYSGFNISCFRRISGNPRIATICQFDAVFSSLQTSAPGNGGANWTAQGWHKYARGESEECEAVGGGHSMANGTWARTKVIEHLYFLDPYTVPHEQIHSTVRRGMTSYWVNQYGQTVGSDSMTGNLVDANNPTSYIGPSPC